MSFDPSTQQRLLDLARNSIGQYLRTGNYLNLDFDEWPVQCLQPAATFVTLHLQGRLRGCIGSVEAEQALVENIRNNAVNAAFNDPRFPPVSAAEFPQLHISLSVLAEPKPIGFFDCAELAAKLRPGVDGLILQAQNRRALFLPQVWESLPEPMEFIRQLKRKAQLPDAIEPPLLQAEVFTVDHIA